MRCEQCGRDMKNAEMWQLAADPKAPTSWSMQQLCWECREHPQQEAQAETEVTEEVASEYEAAEFSPITDLSFLDTDYDIAFGVSD